MASTIFLVLSAAHFINCVPASRYHAQILILTLLI